MSFFAAILLLGQVGTSADVGSATALEAESAPAQAAPVAPDDSPLRPRTDSIQRPTSRAAIADTPENSISESVPAGQVGRLVPSADPQESPRAPSNSQALQVAATMVQEILILDEQSQQHVRRVPLVEALSRLGEPTLQSNAVRAYWELVGCIARVRYASEKVRVLSEIAESNSETDRPLREEAVAAAEADEAAAHDALLAAQYALLRTTGLPLESALPWPADAPLVAPYRTQFETLFAGRPAPLGIRQIHHSLPGKLLLVEKRLAAMAAAETGTDAMLQSYQANQAPLSQLLAAIERLDQSRHQFFNAIIDYNQQIADYSLAVVGTGVRPEVLVSTLIKTSPANPTLVTVPRDVRQATAAEPARPGTIAR